MAAKRKVRADEGLSIHEPTQVKLSELKFAPYNPNKITRIELNSLRASLRKHGMVLNLVVQKHSRRFNLDNVLVGGHQRVTALREEFEERGVEPPELVWAVVLDIDDATAMQLNIALNRIGGEFDPLKLGEIFNTIHNVMSLDDLQATGYDQTEVESLMRLTQPPPPPEDEVKAFASAATLSIEFTSAAERDEARNLLKTLVKEQGRKAGAIVLESVKASAAAKRGRRRTASSAA